MIRSVFFFGAVVSLAVGHPDGGLPHDNHAVPGIGAGVPLDPHLGVGSPLTPVHNIGGPAVPHLGASGPIVPHLGVGSPLASVHNIGGPAVPHLGASGPIVPHLGGVVPQVPHHGVGVHVAPHHGVGLLSAPQYGVDVHPVHQVPAKYSFEYAVHDDYYGNHYGHTETRDGYLTEGSYFVDLPDGRTQTVTYTADEYGYHPVVTYEGTAHHAASPIPHAVAPIHHDVGPSPHALSPIHHDVTPVLRDNAVLSSHSPIPATPVHGPPIYL